MVCHYDKKYSKDVVIYRGIDPVGEFIKCMFREVQNCQKLIKDNFNKPLKMSEDDEINFEKATHCRLIVIFVRKNINLMTTQVKSQSEITVMLQANIVVQLIKMQFVIENIIRKD